MARTYRRIVRGLMILLLAVVPLLGFIDCDLGDGRFTIDLEELGIDLEDDELRLNLW
jgi:hypothetical protein